MHNADAILYFLTDNHGLISCRARKGYKSLRRFFNVFEMGNLCEIDYSFRRALTYYHLDEVNVLQRTEFPLDFLKLFLLHFICELSLWFSRPGLPDVNLFNLTKDTLAELSGLQVHQWRRFLLEFVLRIFCEEGLLHPPYRCSRCKANTLEKSGDVFIRFPDVVLCSRCGKTSGFLRLVVQPVTSDVPDISVWLSLLSDDYVSVFINHVAGVLESEGIRSAGVLRNVLIKA